MAPPTLPTETKRRRGTLRGDRIPGELVPVARAPLTAPPPPSLKEAGKAEWEHSLRTSTWIAESDLAALRYLCEAIDRRDELAKELEKVGSSLMLETSTGYAYANPILTAMDKCEERITKWMSLLGKTPSDRSRLGVAEVHQASTLDKLAARRASRGGPHGSTPPSPRSPSTEETETRSSSSSTTTDG